MFSITRTRKIGFAAMTALFLALPLALPASAAGQTTPKRTEDRKAMSSEELYEFTLKGTCWVTLQNSYGTGWVLNKEKRLVVTNDHVVEGVDAVLVYFPVKKNDAPITDSTWYRQNGKAIPAIVIDRDRRSDLALLQLMSIPGDAHALPIAPVQAKQGQEIMTVGASTHGSQGLWSWGDGKVRNIVDSVFRAGKVRRIESTMPINKGNSGGPAINNKGEVVGVNHAYHGDAAAVSYHIDLGELNSFLALSLPLVDPKDAATFISRADHRLTQGRYAVARDDYTAALKLESKSAAAYHGRGKAYSSLSDFKTAVADFDEALKIAPELQQAFYFRGTAKYETKDYDSATEDLTAAIRLNPKSSRAYNQRGRCYFAQKNWTEAEIDFGRAIELSPLDSFCWQNRGLAREKQGKIDDALADMAKGVDCSPNTPRLWSLFGYMLYRNNRYEAAIKAHGKADEIELKMGISNPIHAEAVGDCWRMQNKYENAIRLYNMALERAEKYAGRYQADECLSSRGFCHRRLENFQASLADHNRSLKINPKNAETYYQRAWTYRALGQWNQVQEDFEKAISLNADYTKKEAPIQTRSFYPGIRR